MKKLFYSFLGLVFLAGVYILGWSLLDPDTFDAWSEKYGFPQGDIMSQELTGYSWEQWTGDKLFDTAAGTFEIVQSGRFLTIKLGDVSWKIEPNQDVLRRVKLNGETKLYIWRYGRYIWIGFRPK